jgi:uncharacterized membrane protein
MSRKAVISIVVLAVVAVVLVIAYLFWANSSVRDVNNKDEPNFQGIVSVR